MTKKYNVDKDMVRYLKDIAGNALISPDAPSGRGAVHELPEGLFEKDIVLKTTSKRNSRFNDSGLGFGLDYFENLFDSYDE